MCWNCDSERTRDFPFPVRDTETNAGTFEAKGQNNEVSS